MTPDANMPDISPDMRDFLGLLIKHGARFALCGGFAVTYYGFIRTTMDIDILVFPSAANAARIMQALAEFGFGNAETCRLEAHSAASSCLRLLTA